MTSDTNDMLRRLKAALPRRWFADNTPLLDGLLTGLASTWVWLYQALAYTKRQTRLGTATDQFLDLISDDFLGTALPRRTAEPDAAFRTRISRELLRERNTRSAIASALGDLTGRAPTIFEPARPTDTGCYNGPLGYGVAGGWGSLLLPFQCFVTAYRPSGSGIAYVAGYGQPTGSYGGGALQYASLSMLTGEIVDADITNAIAHVMPVSTIAWTRILN